MSDDWTLEPLTVGQLRQFIADLPDDWPVQLHNEQDYRVDEWEADEDDGLVLFANDQPSPLIHCPTCGWQSNIKPAVRAQGLLEKSVEVTG